MGSVQDAKASCEAARRVIAANSTNKPSNPDDVLPAAICAAYIRGMVGEANQISYALCMRDRACATAFRGRQGEPETRYRAFCPTESFSLQPAILLFLAFLKDHPDYLNGDDPSLPMTLAWVDAYPCKP